MRYAILKDNVITNIIEADQNFVDNHFPGAMNVENVRCDIGWTLDNGVFIDTISVPGVAKGNVILD